MARAGVQDQSIFGPELMDEIHRRTQGMPRLINAVCDNLLLTAFAMERRTCTLAMLDEVSADIRLTPRRFRPGTGRPAAVHSPQPTISEQIVLISGVNLMPESPDTPER